MEPQRLPFWTLWVDCELASRDFFCLVYFSYFLKTMKNYFVIPDFPVIVIFYRMKKSINKKSDFPIYTSLIVIHRVLLVLWCELLPDGWRWVLKKAFKYFILLSFIDISLVSCQLSRCYKVQVTPNFWKKKHRYKVDDLFVSRWKAHHDILSEEPWPRP